ncbi:MAG: anti-sigma factor RsbA family regulatory protein [Streptosporangiaceae bacterium]
MDNLATRAGSRAASLRHLALVYADPGEYVGVASGFLRAGLAAGARALAVVPAERHAILRAALNRSGGDLDFADMSILGENPARIIPAIEALAFRGSRPVRVITEPIWPGRTPAEIREATKHEALINLAFAGCDAQILCAYDATRLPEPVLADARRTHPQVTDGEGVTASQDFAGAGKMPASCTAPLPPRPAGAPSTSFDGDLRLVRDFIASQITAADLPASRASELVLAVSEVAANTLRHAGGRGTVWCWRAAGEVICEVRDGGHIADPLAGQRQPEPDQVGGHGLWLVNRCVDLAEVRSTLGGTVTRLHVRLPGNGLAGAERGRLAGTRAV